MTVIGLDIQSACAPTVIRRSGSVGGEVQLACGALVTNASGVTLLVAAAAAFPDGRMVADALGWRLLPGQGPETLPAPPTGATWAILSESESAAGAGATWDFVGVLALWGLAGWGLGGIIGSALEAIQRRRR